MLHVHLIDSPVNRHPLEAQGGFANDFVERAESALIRFPQRGPIHLSSHAPHVLVFPVCGGEATAAAKKSAAKTEEEVKEEKEEKQKSQQRKSKLRD